MGITDLIKEFVKTLYLAPMFLLEQVGAVTTAAVSFSGNSAMGTIATALNTGIKSFMPTIMSLAYLITFMFFLLGLIDLCISERLTFEAFVKQFAFLALGWGAIYFSPEVYDAIFKFGNAFSTFIGSTFNPGLSGSNPNTYTALDSALTNLLSQGNMTWVILLLLSTIITPITLLISAGLLVVIYVISFSRLIEIAVRGCLMPIGFSLLSEDGWRGAGGRFFKKMLALCCQGGAIAMIGKIIEGIVLIVQKDAFTQLSVDIADGVFEAYKNFVIGIISGEVIVVGAAVAGIAILFKSLQLINEAFGC